jgi:hypothetical protein
MPRRDLKGSTYREPDKHRAGYVIFPGQGAGVGGRNGFSVPEKFSARIESIEAMQDKIDEKTRIKAEKKNILRGHSKEPLRADRAPTSKRIVHIYLRHGWHHVGDHMLTIEFATRDVTNEDIAIALRDTRRCYCTEKCLDDSSYGRDDDKSIAEVLRLRVVVAEANKIPLDGTDKHEAQIDAALSPKETDHLPSSPGES